MCGKNEDGTEKKTLAALKEYGVEQAHIEGRGFYVDLDNGQVFDKQTDFERDDNPLTVSMMVDEIWSAYDADSDSDNGSKSVKLPKLYAYVEKDKYSDDNKLGIYAYSSREALAEAGLVDGDGKEISAFHPEIQVFVPRGF